MFKDPRAVKVRFSKARISMIWPGLDFIQSAFLLRESGEQLRTTYPFRFYPKPPGFDYGTFSPAMMQRVRRLSVLLKVKQKTGRQIWVDAFELRAAALSVRITLKLLRMRACGKLGQGRKDVRSLNAFKREVGKFDKRKKQIARFLERCMKRANRRLLSQSSQKEFRALSMEWQAHLRWIRFYLAYFKPLPPVLPGGRKIQQQTIDQLESLAQQIIKKEGFTLPDSKALRHVIRLLVNYSRRGRQGSYHYRYILANSGTFDARFVLFKFIESRLELRRAQ